MGDDKFTPEQQALMEKAAGKDGAAHAIAAWEKYKAGNLAGAAMEVVKGDVDCAMHGIAHPADTISGTVALMQAAPLLKAAAKGKNRLEK